MAQCPCGPLTLPLVRAAGVIRRRFADASACLRCVLLCTSVYFAWAGGFSEWACDGELSATTELGSAALRVPELAHAASVVRSFNLPLVRYHHSPANASFAMWGVCVSAHSQEPVALSSVGTPHRPSAAPVGYESSLRLPLASGYSSGAALVSDQVSSAPRDQANGAPSVRGLAATPLRTARAAAGAVAAGTAKVASRTARTARAAVAAASRGVAGVASADSGGASAGAAAGGGSGGGSRSIFRMFSTGLRDRLSEATTMSVATPGPVEVLFGHASPVVAVALSADLGIVASVGSNGMLLFHTARNGKFIRHVNIGRVLLHGLDEANDGAPPTPTTPATPSGPPASPFRDARGGTAHTAGAGAGAGVGAGAGAGSGADARARSHRKSCRLGGGPEVPVHTKRDELFARPTSMVLSSDGHVVVASARALVVCTIKYVLACVHECVCICVRVCLVCPGLRAAHGC